MEISQAALEWLRTAKPHETSVVETCNFLQVENGEEPYYDVKMMSGAYISVPTWGIDRSNLVGKPIYLYGKGIGYNIQAVVIDTNVMFAYTDEEMEAKHKAEMEDIDNKAKEAFEMNKSQMDEDYSKLPEIFRKRIDRFRNNVEDFRWSLESYELLCCKEALRIADFFKTPEKIHAWVQNGYVDKTDNEVWLDTICMEEEKKKVPDRELFVPDDTHSSNTIGGAATLASVYLRAPELVPYIHGAMAPLIGCKNAGCHLGTPQEISELSELKKKYPNF